MKAWEAVVSLFLLIALGALLVYAALTLPLWTFILMLVVVGIVIMSRETIAE